MNINKKNTKVIYSIIALFIFLPLIAGAAGLVPCGGPNENACGFCDLLVLTQRVLDFALKMAFLVIIGFIVYGGFRWIFSLGKEENLKAGQQIITNAIIGLIIILTAWIIVNTVFWTIKQMGGDDYTGTWFHIECPASDNVFNAQEESNIPADDEIPNDQSSEPEPELNCVDCGGSLLDGNICNEEECLSLGNCKYYNYIAWPGGFCKPEQNIGDDEEWGDSTTISSPNQKCITIEHSLGCEDGFKLNKSKCEPGEHTTTIEDYITSNGKGQYCKFRGDNYPIGSEFNPCYPPNGTLYIDCVIDPNYISPEEQIETKKKEIEEKYPDLEGEWKEDSAMCQAWEQNCTEVQATADCGTQKTIKDGFCLATEPNKLLNSPGEIMGNGWFCEFGKSDINDPSPEGKSFAYCIPKETEIPTDPIDSESEPETGTYKACRVSNWTFLSGNQTLYCKETDWTGEKPADECSIIDEVCSDTITNNEGLPEEEQDVIIDEVNAELETGTYKDCEFYLNTGTSACVTKTWSGIENKPDGNFCENDSFCQKFIYKVCRVNIETEAPFCKASVWYGSSPKPDNECEDNSDCQPTSTSGTYKACKVSNWTFLSGNQTLYCKETDWTGEKPADECSIIDEVCPVESGAF
jgi:hypothetical protein